MADDSQSPKQFGMHEAKSNLSKLIHMAQAGDEVLITNNGIPVAKIVPIRPEQRPSRIGFLKGVTFDTESSAAMDAEIDALFHRGDEQ
jgi:prevent-host-death family protein